MHPSLFLGMAILVHVKDDVVTRVQQRSQVETMDIDVIHLEHVDNILQLDWLGSDSHAVLRTQGANQGDGAKERDQIFSHSAKY